MPIAPGTRLGPYEILASLGAGGMGEVFRAKDTKLDREAAIKVLPVASDIIVGAGGVVVKTIDSPGTYAGVPVRRIS